MAANNSRGVLKFNGGSEQKVLKLNYSVSRSTDVSGRVASDPSNALIKITIEATVKAYFKQYRLLANRLLENKNNPKIKIDQNGETYYWLSNYFAPLITQQESL